MRIKPRIGLDDIVFGMTRAEVSALIGDSNEVRSEDFPNGDSVESWYFPDKGYALHFESNSDWRLKTIEAWSASAILMGQKIMGMSRPKLHRLFEKKHVEWGQEEAQDGVSYCATWDMNFWFKSRVVESVQWEVAIDDQDQYLWPAR